MKDEYIIINRTTLKKRIEELKKELETLGDTCEGEIHTHGYMFGEINQLDKILSQSVPLIPEIEKAFLAGRSIDNIDSIDDIKPTYTQFEDYIPNLKLDI